MYTSSYYEGSVSASSSSAAHSSARLDGLNELELARLSLNQIDYGIAVVEAEKGSLQFANAFGQDALMMEPAPGKRTLRDHGLRLEGRQVVARRVADTETLQRTLHRTRAGLRGLLSLGPASKGSPVAVVPLSPPQVSVESVNRRDYNPDSLPPCYALLVFAKQHLCDNSTIALYARERGLTSAESQVLAQVCRGLRPSEIAAQNGVQISTVRTQLRSIRMKTQCDTIRQLVQQVSVLPPIALHMSSLQAAN